MMRWASMAHIDNKVLQPMLVAYCSNPTDHALEVLIPQCLILAEGLVTRYNHPNPLDLVGNAVRLMARKAHMLNPDRSPAFNFLTRVAQSSMLMDLRKDKQEQRKAAAITDHCEQHTRTRNGVRLSFRWEANG